MDLRSWPSSLLAWLSPEGRGGGGASVFGCLSVCVVLPGRVGVGVAQPPGVWGFSAWQPRRTSFGARPEGWAVLSGAATAGRSSVGKPLSSVRQWAGLGPPGAPGWELADLG